MLAIVISPSRFQKAYGDSVHTAVPYAMNSEFSGELAKEMVC